MDRVPKPKYVGRREFVIGGVMAAASGIAYARRPQPSVGPLQQLAFENAVPQVIGEWRSSDNGSVVLPPPDALRDRLYDNLLTRVYLSPTGQVLMLVMAYKNVQDGIVQVHRPEICYPAAGFVLESEQHMLLDLNHTKVPAKAFEARRPDRVEQVLYFTRMGPRFPLSWRDQRLAVLEENLRGVIPDGLLARVSIIQNDQASALPVLARFFEALASTGGATLRAVVSGHSRSTT